MEETIGRGVEIPINPGEKGKGQGLQFRHLSYRELMDRKHKGLCICLECHLKLMAVDDNRSAGGKKDIITTLEVENKGKKKIEWRILDLTSMVNIDISHKKKTMQLDGKIRKIPIVVLVNSRATFISMKLVLGRGFGVRSHSLGPELAKSNSMMVIRVGLQGKCPRHDHL